MFTRQAFRIVAFIAVVNNMLWAYFDVRIQSGNQWKLCLSNFGKFGQTRDYRAGAWWPRNTWHNYIYGAGFDIGGIKPNGDTVVTIGYGPHGGESEYAPGPAYANPKDPQWHVYFSSDLDYPFSPISLQDAYAIYNDLDSSYHIPDSFKVLGVTVTHKTYVWPIDWADDVVFFKYIVKNDTTFPINDIYLGIPIDFDIGNEAGISCNDRCGLDLQRKLFYGWQEEPEPGWDSRGMLGYKLLTPCSLSAYKRFTLAYEPNSDREWYLTMAGYNFQTGMYEPYDTIWPLPDDQRIIMASGPFTSLAPGDSIIIDWALIASNDTIPPCPELFYKADKAQACYDAGWHNAHVIDPNGGEVVSGTYAVSYSATSVTPNPLLINFYLFSENGIDTIALNQSNTGAYNWNTSMHPDGVFYRIMIIGHDTVTFGGDISDGIFTIDNPGNAPPGLVVFTPMDSDTLSGNYDITWFARDPEFQDSLLINIYFKSQYDTVFQLIASNEPNDSIYTWNTVPYRNGSGVLVVETQDEEFTVAETIQVYLFNQISGGQINHISGLNNCVNLSVLVHDSLQITGHTYELRFLEYRALPNADSSFYCPEYIYEIEDSNTGVIVLDTYSLKDGYTFYGSTMAINDFSPIIDGFSMRSYTPSPIIFSNFRNDSVKVVSGSYPEDSIFSIGPSGNTWWAYRGSRLQLDWVTHANGGLTLFVTDLDYGDTIPYKPYTRLLNPESAFGWCFHPWIPINAPPSETLRVGYDRLIMLCGDQIRFSRTIPPPVPGDRWIVYPSEYSPPIKGNVYRFTPHVGIAEAKTQMLPISFQIFPVPCRKNLTIAYSLPKKQKIKLVIYDVLGRQVKKLKDGIENPGVHEIMWNGTDDGNRRAPSGVYFCRFAMEENYTDTKKFVLLK